MIYHRPRRRRRPSVTPERGQGLLDTFFKRIKMQEQARGFFAMRAFQQCAGPRIRSRARAQSMRGATLYIRVVSSAWSQELNSLKPQLLEKLHETPGGETVADLRFSVGPLDGLPIFDEPKPAPAPTAQETGSGTHLPSEEVESAISHVDDEELRRELRHLFARLGEVKAQS